MEKRWFYDSVLMDKYEIVESKSDIMLLKGRVQYADRINDNGRIYPYSLFEKLFKDPMLWQKIKKRLLLGELEHPEDGMTKLPRVAWLITHMCWGKDREVIGDIEILDTPNGLILQRLAERAIPIGASSRGKGTSYNNGKAEVVNDDYDFDTIDAVYNPSTQGAYPSLQTPIIQTVAKERSIHDQKELAALENLIDVSNIAANQLDLVSSPSYYNEEECNYILERCDRRLLELKKIAPVDRICEEIYQVLKEAKSRMSKNKSGSAVDNILKNVRNQGLNENVADIHPNDLSNGWTKVEDDMDYDEGDMDYDEDDMDYDEDDMDYDEGDMNYDEDDMDYDEDDMDYDEDDMDYDEDDMDYDEDDDYEENRHHPRHERSYYASKKESRQPPKKRKNESRKTKKKQTKSEDLHGLSRLQLINKYRNSLKLCESLRDRCNEYKKANTRLAERYEASVNLMSKIVERVENSKNEEMIENAIKNNPKLEEFRTLLESCVNSKELETAIEKLSNYENVNETPSKFDESLSKSPEKFLSQSPLPLQTIQKVKRKSKKSGDLESNQIALAETLSSRLGWSN